MEPGRYPWGGARLPEGVWPLCKKCFDEVDPAYADVQTIVNRYHVIKQVLVHPWCNWHVKDTPYLCDENGIPI